MMTKRQFVLSGCVVRRNGRGAGNWRPRRAQRGEGETFEVTKSEEEWKAS